MEKFFPELAPVQLRNSYWRFTCPQCKKKHSMWLRNGNGKTFRCSHKNTCGYVKDVWEYLLDRQDSDRQSAFLLLKEIKKEMKTESD